ncbi:hypothetical protein O6H91_07G093200 [Diphasiastrum complanatum]|uniref:Uncharacterized protein n=2 Tax=Diphasiastrum complanatum TaxID=34168 RepID=A0ACC2D728_DIPCM|nr:hypothetical protein O6H91_07G082800 [Diphasiastrum complanatum]KAJ7550294.1 hypothetical protein O6H91_07G093200 [Diphasiastrum complanatum]
MRIQSCVPRLWQLVLLFVASLMLLLVIPIANADSDDLPTPVAGLSYGFYKKSCPKAENNVKRIMKPFLKSNVSQAAGVIRLFFHDCFVQGCDGSILINDTLGEQPSIPNQTLRASALNVIEQIKANLESICPNTVSCADVLALAAREAIRQAGGLRFEIPTGRRDSLNFSNSTIVLQNLPGPSFDLSQLVSSFSSKGLSIADMITLSGAHTVGIAHCNSFSKRLRPTVDPRFNQKFANSLIQSCPNSSINVAIDMDILTPNKFDNKYFRDLLNGKVLFNSDASLLNDSQTQAIVENYADDNDVFRSNFTISFIKMSMIQVLTGNQGNIRKVCSVLNSKSSSTATAIDSYIPAEFDTPLSYASM